MSATTVEIERALETEAGVHAAAEEDGDELVVTGLVETIGVRKAALEIVTTLAPEKRIVDNLEVVGVLPEEVEGLSLSKATVGDFPGATPETSDDEDLEPGNFTDPEILKNPLGAAGPPGDEAIADVLRRELREDVATTDLDVEVSVFRGVVRLRGTVPTLDDAENVEEVAFRIEGVVDVFDELKISELL